VPARKCVLQPGILVFVFLSTSLFAQSKTPTANTVAAQEFPVTMRQKVVAGTTPVGAKVEANLAIATLVGGKVVPVGATFTGEVVQSSAKSASDPCRLAIRINNVRWKGQSLELKAYLTAWYYPMQLAGSDDHSDDQSGEIHGNVGVREGGRSNTPFPSNTAPDGMGLPSGPTSKLSEHRKAMKDVDSMYLDDGTLALTSTRFNIKIDKSTTYVLATGDLSPQSKPLPDSTSR
jgi:hypothetical protein